MNKNLIKRGVGVAIYRTKQNKEIEFLLLHRIENWVGWSILKGGIEEGETQRKTVIREMEEELNINNMLIKKIFPIHHTFDFVYPPEMKKKFKIARTFSWAVELPLKEGIIKVDYKEHDDFIWASLEQTVSLLTLKDHRNIILKAEPVINQQTKRPNKSKD